MKNVRQFCEPHAQVKAMLELRARRAGKKGAAVLAETSRYLPREWGKKKGSSRKGVDGLVCVRVGANE